ncbi:hypothetical protein HPP92_014212 [Vanilla planifolia]|uniref:Uncharacterized protein n=1 Tax=Vanilla planifolia TaxID=51239 RepID=A0A835UZC2_VANPL|nr:hypothetical protein HPP92_014212 [Vanilla planifolia]
MENDEMSILIALLKSKFTEICCDVQRYNLEVEQHNRKTEVRVTILREQLENRTVALIQALAELSKERKMVESLKTRIEKLEYVKNEYITLQKELNSCESVLTELAENVDRITEEAALMEIDLKENLREVSYTLDEANISLSEKMCSLEEVEFKLREQRKVISHSEHVKCDLDAELKRYHQENYETRTRMEPAVLERKELEKLLTEEKESFHRTLEEKERRIHELEQQNIMLQEQLAGKDLETSAAHKTDLHQLVAKENQAFQAFAENVHRRLNFMLAALETLELNHKTGVDGILINLEESKSRCLGFLEEKLCVITDIKECIMSCDQERIRLVEEVANYKHADMFLGDTKLHEELDNIISAQILDKQEMKYRNFLISELEKDVASLQVKLESEEKLSSSLAGSIKEIQAQLGKEKFQVDIELCNSLRFLENKKETQVNRGAVIEIMEKFPPWKEVLIEQMKDFHAFLCKVNNEGEDMRKHWEKIYQKASFLVETDIHIEGEEPASSKQ